MHRTIAQLWNDGKRGNQRQLKTTPTCFKNIKVRLLKRSWAFQKPDKLFSVVLLIFSTYMSLIGICKFLYAKIPLWQHEQKIRSFVTVLNSRWDIMTLRDYKVLCGQKWTVCCHLHQGKPTDIPQRLLLRPPVTRIGFTIFSGKKNFCVAP